MKIELVFIPAAEIGHLRSTVELAKKLLNEDDRLSITVLIIPRPSADDSDHVTPLFTPSQDRLLHVTISAADQPPDVPLDPQAYMDNQKPKVRDAVSKLLDSPPRLAGFVVDMFCTSMIEVADEFKVPTYMMYTSNAAFLGITLHLQLMFDEKKYDVSELDESVNELDFPCLTRPYPVKCLPYLFTSKQWLPFFFDQARNFRKMKEDQRVRDGGGAWIGGVDTEVL
ncbi:UDP-glycosyltransferase 71B5-like isoform X2 [Brassica napus]|uniref:UDP-glycosyltransferase 71B5-like isoform X2 n=1 Tax=Brassica napus TaxID=3708 RepID=UPI002078C9CB|nr:UDP-glycosyltransferase 71B5-like isoform X2 [Brassica napus]